MRRKWYLIFVLSCLIERLEISNLFVSWPFTIHFLRTACSDSLPMSVVLNYCFSLEFIVRIYIVLLVLLFTHSENFHSFSVLCRSKRGFSIKILSGRKMTLSLLSIIKHHTATPALSLYSLGYWKIIRNLGSGFSQVTVYVHHPCTHPPLEDWTGSCQETSSPRTAESLRQKQRYLHGGQAVYHQRHPLPRASSSASPKDISQSCLHVRGDVRWFCSELNIYNSFFQRKLHVLYLPGRRHCAPKDTESACLMI